MEVRGVVIQLFEEWLSTQNHIEFIEKLTEIVPAEQLNQLKKYTDVLIKVQLAISEFNGLKMVP